MGDSGSRDAAAGLAAHSKDAAVGPARQGGNGAQLADVADEVERLLQSVAQLARDRPLTALLLAGALGWFIGRAGKYL